MLREKNNRYGTKKLSFKLNSIYEYALRTLEEVSVEEESTSSNIFQERPSEDSKVNEVRILKRPAANNIEFKHVLATQDSLSESSTDKNCCSTNSRRNKKTKFKNNRTSWFKKLFISDSELFNHENSVKYVPNKKEADIKSEQAQAHTIIFNIEEKSQCKQVSL